MYFTSNKTLQINHLFSSEKFAKNENRFAIIINGYNAVCKLYNGKIDIKSIQKHNGYVMFALIFDNENDCLQCQKFINQLKDLGITLENNTITEI